MEIGKTEKTIVVDPLEEPAPTKEREATPVENPEIEIEVEKEKEREKVPA